MNWDSSMPAAQAAYTLARAWHSKGTLAAAIAGYRAALALDPGHLEAAILLGALMQSQLRLDEALEIYRGALDHHPNDARLHKQFANVMLTQEGPDAVFRHYGLVRKDARHFSPRPAEILCCTVVKNDFPRLPYFLEHYRQKGIGTFLAVDKGSTDGSLEYLLNQPDVYVWQSDLSFNGANFGAVWFEPVLRTHGQNHRCLMVDIKESLDDPAQSVKPEDRLFPKVVFPKIDQVSAEERPLWSVMLTVYRRTRFLEQALRSVLAQAPGRDEMQIELVSDGPDDERQTEIEAMVRSITGDRIGFYRHPVRAGQPEIFNICVRRARGVWVHILHDDDWVAPGFYQALYEGTVRAPEIGAAFCRHTHVDEEGRSVSRSVLERETPGIIECWLDRIGCSCRLQTPSIVVRREAYERLGGYCPQARSALDWEMWQRIAVHYPVWYEPRPLAFFRRSAQSEGSRVKASGEQIAHTRAVIEIARSYLPAAKVEALSRRAGEHYALFAFELARQQLEAGNPAGAIANLREGIRCSRSDDVVHKLVSWLSPAAPPKA